MSTTKNAQIFRIFTIILAVIMFSAAFTVLSLQRDGYAYGTGETWRDHCKFAVCTLWSRHQLFEDRQPEKGKNLHCCRNRKGSVRGDVVQAEIWFKERLRFLEIRLHKTAFCNRSLRHERDYQYEKRPFDCSQRSRIFL